MQEMIPVDSDCHGKVIMAFTDTFARICGVMNVSEGLFVGIIQPNLQKGIMEEVGLVCSMQSVQFC